MGFVVVKRHATSKKSPASNLNLARTNEMDGHGQDVNVIDSIGAAIGSLFSQENRWCDDGVGSFMLTTLFLDAAACFPRSPKTGVVDSERSVGSGDWTIMQKWERHGWNGSDTVVGSAGISEGSDGGLKDATTTALEYCRKLRKAKDEYARLDEQVKMLSERLVATAAQCKKEKVSASDQDKELAAMKKELRQLRQARQQCSAEKSRLLASNAEERKNGVCIFSTKAPRPSRKGSCIGMSNAPRAMVHIDFS